MSTMAGGALVGVSSLESAALASALRELRVRRAIKCVQGCGDSFECRAVLAALVAPTPWRLHGLRTRLEAFGWPTSTRPYRLAYLAVVAAEEAFRG